MSGDRRAGPDGSSLPGSRQLANLTAARPGLGPNDPKATPCTLYGDLSSGE